MTIVLLSAMTGAALGSKHQALASGPTPPTGQWFDYVLTIMVENHSINFWLANTNGLAEGLTNAGVNASAASAILGLVSLFSIPSAQVLTKTRRRTPRFTMKGRRYPEKPRHLTARPYSNTFGPLWTVGRDLD